MGIFRYAVAAGIGYYAGQPEGRRQLTTLRRRAAELARSPEVRRLRERGWDLAGDAALATRNAAAKARRARPDSAATADPGAGTEPADLDRPVGFNGTTVAEDSKAVTLGLSAPPLAARARPAAPPEDRV